MKIKLTLLLAPILMVSCVTPPGSTIAKLGAGSDAASLNASRGRADAQISKSQADQYSRQRNQVSEEMQLEQQKRSNMIDNVGGIISILR